MRKISHSADDKSVEAVVARMEAALNEDRLGDVLAEAKTLPPPAQDVARDFLAKVEARNAVDARCLDGRNAAQGFARGAGGRRQRQSRRSRGPRHVAA